jgi:hypothetical protein
VEYSTPPERPEAPKVLFFCRGRGRGHAVPDLVIADELRRLDASFTPVFASYGTGAATLAENGHTVLDLRVKEDSPFIEIMVAATRLIAVWEPDVVISHEEFAALPAAKSFLVPTAFLVDFFLASDHLWMQSLQYADEILFIERRGLFAEPHQVKGRVQYAGPIVRPFAMSRADRGRARDQLALSPTATVVSVIPGAWATEARAPMFDVVSSAFEALDAPEKILVWVAGGDFDALCEKAAPRANIRVIRGYQPVETLMVASDLAITKANRGTTLELASLGIRSISLSLGLNPIDETIIPRIPSNRALNANGIDTAFLTEVMESCLADDVPPAPPTGAGGESAVAEKLAAFVASAACRTRRADA